MLGSEEVREVIADLCDGERCLRMRDLNAADRAAIRNGDLRAGLGEYTPPSAASVGKEPNEMDVAPWAS